MLFTKFDDEFIYSCEVGGDMCSFNFGSWFSCILFCLSKGHNLAK